MVLIQFFVWFVLFVVRNFQCVLCYYVPVPIVAVFGYAFKRIVINVYKAETLGITFPPK